MQLPMLRNLNISRNQIRELPECAWTASLNVLDVSANELSVLPRGIQETNMFSLNVRENRFVEVCSKVLFSIALSSLVCAPLLQKYGIEPFKVACVVVSPLNSNCYSCHSLLSVLFTWYVYLNMGGLTFFLCYVWFVDS